MKKQNENREVKAKLTIKTKQIGKNVKVRNKNGKVKNIKKIKTEFSAEKLNGEVKIKKLKTKMEK